ncbi:MAG: CvpA family protein [Candidatus Omnitrophica bacterium]|nr:CvpA family protein [Candidatus Omnitrophota bacterium]
MLDIIVLVTIILFALGGLHKGFCQYLLELLITLISLGAGLWYYQRSQATLTSLLVCSCVFLALSVIKWLWFKLRRKDASTKPSLSITNRCLGALLGLFWGILMAALCIFAIQLLPLDLMFKYDLKNRIHSSKSHKILEKLVPIKKVKVLETLNYMGKISHDQEAQERLGKQKQFKKLLKHESLRKLMDDPETIKQFQDKDLQALLGNPKVRELLNDGDFVEELFKIDFEGALNGYYEKLGD